MRFQKLTVAFCLAISLFAACSKDNGDQANANPTSSGGSLARFTISGNYLYLADYSVLRVFDISNPALPAEKPQVYVGIGVETIFPYKDKLFIGSTQGMYVYSLTTPAAPVKLGSVLHIRSCDPVVANDSISFTTLLGGSRCGPAESGLYIYDIGNVTSPYLKKMVPLTTPYGLGLADSILFVCCGENGLFAINVKDPVNPQIRYTRNDGVYMDVIPYNDLLICYVKSGILVYDASDPHNITKVGEVDY